MIAGLVFGALVIAGGFGIGYFVFDDGDQETATPATDDDAAGSDGATSGDDRSTDDEFDPGPFAGDLGDLGDLFPEELEELLPEDFDDFGDLLRQQFAADVHASLVFGPDATPRQTRRIMQAWEDEPVLSGVFFLDLDDMDGILPDAMRPGLPGASVSAFGDKADANRIRSFACSFTDAPGVDVVLVLGTRPCDQSL